MVNFYFCLSSTSCDFLIFINEKISAFDKKKKKKVKHSIWLTHSLSNSRIHTKSSLLILPLSFFFSLLGINRSKLISLKSKNFFIQFHYMGDYIKTITKHLTHCNLVMLIFNALCTQLFFSNRDYLLL